MTDHYHEAERLSERQPAGFRRLRSQGGEAYTGRCCPAQLAAAQLHATLAVADQLAGAQDGPDPR
jgi:hypothetical protein